MRTLFKMAWRNLWRNKRRTLITMASVFLAVFLALVMRSFQLGSYRKMTEDVVRSYSGYIQIHAQAYWDNKTLDYSFEPVDSLTLLLRNISGVTGLIPRLESFALASGLEQTKGILVVGIDPDAEDVLTGLSRRVVQGRYLAIEESGVLVAEKLAQFLKVTVGDTLVLLSQGYHGVSAANKYPIMGVVHFAAPQLNSQLVYMTLCSCQEFFGAQARITSLALDLQKPEETDLITAQLRRILPAAEYEVMPWHEMQVELVQQIDMDNASGLFLLGILYMIVTFGIFGTLMMMVNERHREFGVMLALGMRRKRLLGMITIETAILSLLALLCGIAASVPIIYHFTHHPVRLSGEVGEAMVNYGFEPVFPFLFEFPVFLHQALLIGILTALAALYPFISIRRMSIVRALHG